MAEDNKAKVKKLVSRRDFLTVSGAVIAAGALSACTPKAVTDTVTNTVTNTVTSTKATTVTSTIPASTVTGAGQTVTKTVTAAASGTGTTGTVTTSAAATTMTVLNPLGTPSPITLLSMAKRLDTLDGKTIYVVDIMYPYTQVYMQEVTKILQAKYPKTTWVYRQKYGVYSDDDPDTWNLIQAKGNGMVVGVGH